tara:strand:+ start:387 stop:704 length:318 start_codon:yes stop_codon:yes gene_type:complete
MRGFDLAVEAAKSSNVINSQHGCVILGPRDAILASASNRKVRCRAPGLFTEHAEEAAIRMVRAKDVPLIKCMYVTRVNGNRSSMPCWRCRLRIEQLKGSFPIYYT